MLDAILFDLDGTLLPMDNDEFTKVYLARLAKTAAGWGNYEPEKMVAALWAGVRSMVKNDGSKKNVDAFWATFSETYGRDCSGDIPKFDAFYKNEFMEIISITAPTELAKLAVDAARKKAKYVILASNPIFPRVATDMRMSWTGLSGDMFDHVTDYSNSGFCKPNPEYYRDILKRFDIAPEKCVMIGNDVDEDLEASRLAGITSQYIVTDYILNRKEKEITCPSGTYSDMIKYIESL